MDERLNEPSHTPGKVAEFSKISPYKDGAYPRSDANSFPSIKLDAGKNKE